MKPDDKTIQEIKAAHPDRRCGKVTYQPTGAEQLEFVIVSPSRVEWKRFMEEILNEDKRSMATEKLVKECVRFPAKKEFEELLNKYPAAVTTIGKHVQELAGSSLKSDMQLL